MTQMTPDIRDEIFRTIRTKRFTAKIFSKSPGVLAGAGEAAKEAKRLGVKCLFCLPDGTPVETGGTLAVVSGTPRQIAAVGEALIGRMAKASGIATSARKFVDAAAGRIRIVSTAWKKKPSALKPMIQAAVSAGGADIRITEEPFVFLDKNYVMMFGGVLSALESARSLADRCLVVQIEGAFADIGDEAFMAAEQGAGIIYVDTGDPEDIERVSRTLSDRGLRRKVRIAFAGGIRLGDISSLMKLDVDIVDVGRAIADAPLLDMHMVVVEDQQTAPSGRP